MHRFAFLAHGGNVWGKWTPLLSLLEVMGNGKIVKFLLLAAVCKVF